MHKKELHERHNVYLTTVTQSVARRSACTSRFRAADQREIQYQVSFYLHTSRENMVCELILQSAYSGHKKIEFHGLRITAHGTIDTTFQI